MLPSTLSSSEPSHNVNSIHKFSEVTSCFSIITEDLSLNENIDYNIIVTKELLTGDCHTPTDKDVLDCNVSKADNSLNSEELVNDIVNNGIHTINHSILTNYSVENRAHLESVNENANNYVSVSDSNSGSISTLRDCNPRSPDISVIDDLNTVINLKIMVWNIHGLGDKLKDADFLQCISKYDLVIFLETMKLDTYSPDTGKFVYKHLQRHYQHP